MVGEVHVVSLIGLRRRLKAVLGDDSLLFQRLDSAIRRQDQASIEAAMEAMRRYPLDTQRAVEKAMLDWLTDATDASSFANMPAASDAIN